MADPVTRAHLTRRAFTAAAGAALAAPPALPQASPVPAPPAQPAAELFPFGTHIYREPSWPLEQLRADLPVLKRLGFNMVKIQESWSADERREGVIDLARVEQVISDARQNGLRVYFGFTMEQAPAWLWRKFPDASMQYETGQPHNDPTQYLLPEDGKPGPCWHHAGARSAAEHFMETAVARLARFDNIVVWNVWQEIGFGELRPGHLGVCYCLNTLAAYRDYLKTRYATVDALNAAWRSAYGEWEEVEPPRLFAAVPSWFDWRHFMDSVYLPWVLRWKGEAVRRADPAQRPILAHTSGASLATTVDWRWAEAVDLYGSSVYPSWDDLDEPGEAAEARRPEIHKRRYQQFWNTVLMKFDLVRAASRAKGPGGKFWTAELEGGRASGGLTPGRVPGPRDIRLWTLGTIAAGSSGVSYWNHRSELFWTEAYGFGLLDLEGETTPRAAEAGRMGKALQKYARLFTEGSVPLAAAAIVCSERLHQFFAASGAGQVSALEKTTAGLWKALFEEGYQAEFADAAFLPGKPVRQRALLLPMPWLLDAEAIRRLREFVHDGGTVIAEACPGRFEAFGFGTPGEMAAPLQELFGVHHKQLYTLAPESKSRPRLTGAGPLAGITLEAERCLQLLEPAGAEVILTLAAEAAGVRNHFGDGQAILLGTLVGAAVEAGREDGKKALTALLTQAGVKPDRAGRLLRRRRVLDARQAWFLFNTSAEAVEELVPLEGRELVADLLGEPAEVAGKAVRVKVPPLDVRCLIVDQPA
jgi:beta-galactosidase GanA